MITMQIALSLVKDKLAKLEDDSKIKLGILTDETIVFEYGWMFFYQSEEYILTGDESKLVGGNAPFIVDKYDGSIHETGTAREEEFYINNYIKNRGELE